MTEPVDGKKIFGTIQYVRDFYRHVTRLLQAADPIVGIDGWEVQRDSWKAVPTHDRSVRGVERWLPHFVVRQYFRRRDPAEVLTLAAIVHDPIDERIDEPLFLAARLRWRTTVTDDIYWIPLMQLRRIGGIGDHGRVVRIRKEHIEPKPHRSSAWDALVVDDELLSVVVPLVGVVDEATLQSTLSELLAASLEGVPAAP